MRYGVVITEVRGSWWLTDRAGRVRTSRTIGGATSMRLSLPSWLKDHAVVELRKEVTK